MLDLEQLENAFPGYRLVKTITENHSDIETITVTIEYVKNHIGLLAQLQRAKQSQEHGITSMELIDMLKEKKNA
jgi:hypothetical protein